MAAGSVVNYTFTVQNTGVVTVHSLAITDNQPALSPIFCPTRYLTPGQTIVCTASYTLTQYDLNHGSVTDFAIATAQIPNGSGLTSPIAGATVPLSQDPHLTLKKLFTPLQASSVAAPIAAGSTAHYGYVVTNDGNITLSGLSVSDDHIAASRITCPQSALGPGESMACRASYALTQADVNLGAVTNTATVHGVEPDGAKVTSPAASATVKIPQLDRLSLVKRVALATSPATVGTQIRWNFVVTNTGTTSVAQVAVVDPMTGLSAVHCPTTSLVPGASTTCSAISTVTPADVQTGWLINHATATGVAPSGARVTSPAAAVIVDTEVAAPKAPVTTTTTTAPTTTTTAKTTSPTTTSPTTTSPTTTSRTTSSPTTTGPPASAPSSRPPLAFTGAEVAGTSLVGAAMIAGGGGLVLVARRRRDRYTPKRRRS